MHSEYDRLYNRGRNLAADEADQWLHHNQPNDIHSKYWEYYYNLHGGKHRNHFVSEYALLQTGNNLRVLEK
jgi:hypothetical protein